VHGTKLDTSEEKWYRSVRSVGNAIVSTCPPERKRISDVAIRYLLKPRASHDTNAIWKESYPFINQPRIANLGYFSRASAGYRKRQARCG
jgi:hypothetical protein